MDTMPFCAGNLLELLESDLKRAGWGRLIDPQTVGDTVFDHVCSSLRNSLLKKFVPKGDKASERQRNQKALATFLEDNEKCLLWTPPRDELLGMLFNEMKVSLDDFFHPAAGRDVLLTFSSILQGIDVGNGANIGVPNVDFYSKVCMGSFSYSSDALRQYLDVAFSERSPWRALLSRSPYHGVRFRKVVGSKIAFAKKNADTSRTICEEPLAEMLFQKGIENLLRPRLRQVYFIDLEDQQVHNRSLAREGSRNGRFATIDLRSASNRNAKRMVQHLLPQQAFSWFERCRTPRVVLPDNSVLDLHMLSTMGNGYTFPLQTIIFATAVRVVYKYLGIPMYTGRCGESRNFAVFGDDIIVVTEAYALVTQLLEALGHEVNSEKSFFEGPFRESCGGDYCHGVNVRGVYIKHLDIVNDYYSSINRLNIWSAQHGIPLVSTCEYLLQHVRGRDELLVPLHEAVDAGIRVPLGLRAGVRYVKNKGHKYLCSVTKTRQVDFLTESAFVKRKTAVLAAYENALRDAKQQGRRRPMSKHEKYWANAWYNPSGHLLSAIGGKLFRGSYVLREFSRRTSKRVRHSPCWDYYEPSGDESRSLGHDLIIMSYINLGKLM